MAEGYTQNEIDLMMKPIHEKLDRIIVQVEKTNGRVDSLERWRSFIAGGLAILTVLVLPVLISAVRSLTK